MEKIARPSTVAEACMFARQTRERHAATVLVESAAKPDESWFEVPETLDSRLVSVCRYWQSRRHGDVGMPLLAEVRASELNASADLCFLIEVLEEPPRFRFTFASPALVQLYRRDLVGAYRRLLTS